MGGRCRLPGMGVYVSTPTYTHTYTQYKARGCSRGQTPDLRRGWWLGRPTWQPFSGRGVGAHLHMFYLGCGQNTVVTSFVSKEKRDRVFSALRWDEPILLWIFLRSWLPSAFLAIRWAPPLPALPGWSPPTTYPWSSFSLPRLLL